MKRSFILLASLAMTSSLAFAQENLAIGATATAYVDGVALTDANTILSIDGNTGTRFEFTGGQVNDANENVAYVVDLGEAKTFNTIQLIWEGAYSKSFRLEVSNDGVDYTPVVNVTDEELSGFPVTKNYKFDTQKARYVRFVNIARGTQWGVSFWEMGIYNAESSIFTSLRLNADKSVVKVGETVNFTPVAADQMGTDMAVPAGLAYAVDPASAGKFAGNIFTAEKSGKATVVANIGEVASNPVELSIYSGEKIDIFSNWQNMVVAGDGVETGSMVGGFDDNMESVWDLGGGDGTDYAKSFSVDFGATYDITALSITFEGACPADYNVVAVAADGTETTLQNVVDHAGMNTFTDFVICDAKDVRSIKFTSTKAATPYGIKIFDFSVYGENMRELPDNAAPTDLTAAVVEDSESFLSVDLLLKAKDDMSSSIFYNITAKAEGKADVNAVATGSNDTEIAYTLGGLEADTEYAITVTAKDAKGNESAPVALTAKTSAMEAAPLPTLAKDYVLPIYNDTPYGNRDGLNINPDWGQQTRLSEIEIDGNKTLYLENTNYQGIEFPVLDADGCKSLRFDIYPINTTSIRVTPIWFNVEAGANYKEVPYIVEGLAPNKWNNVVIDLSNFDSDDRNGKMTTHQIKFDEGNNKSFLVDNIYYASDRTVAVEIVDVENGEAEYYNLQGARVANPAKGQLVIKVQNGNAVKVIF